MELSIFEPGRFHEYSRPSARSSSTMVSPSANNRVDVTGIAYKDILGNLSSEFDALTALRVKTVGRKGMSAEARLCEVTVGASSVLHSHR
jgi:hypothetical protein